MFQVNQRTKSWKNLLFSVRSYPVLKYNVYARREPWRACRWWLIDSWKSQDLKYENSTRPARVVPKLSSVPIDTGCNTRNFNQRNQKDGAVAASIFACLFQQCRNGAAWILSSVRRDRPVIFISTRAFHRRLWPFTFSLCVSVAKVPKLTSTT